MDSSKKIFLAIACIFILVLSFGCTNQPATKGDTNKTDTNKTDTNKLIDINGSILGPAQNGDNVSVYYTLKDTNGNLIESNAGKKTFDFKIGAQGAIKGFNDAVIGMKVGESKTVIIPPENAYGAVQYTDANQFQDPSTIKVGTVFTAGNFEIKIVSIDGNKIGFLPNHPLAGETLVFDIYLVSIKR
jgi:FKBP-type peptidyl-prolyl cis-trans isomerase 2